MRLSIKPLLLVAALCITGCELFTAPKIDLLDKISEEVAWANAAKLAVSVYFKTEWGSSPQEGRGNCGDTRKGFEFDVEFRPSAAYSLVEWRAYATSSLPGDWQDDPDTKLAGIEQVTDVLLPLPNPNGGIGKVTVNTDKAITLVPWCIAMPRVIRTDPPMDAQGGNYSCNKTITIYFAASIDESTVKFGSDCIAITMTNSNGSGTPQHIDGTGSPSIKHYKDPVWNSGLGTVTIAVEDTGPPEDKKITVKLGPGIKSNLGGKELQTLEFSWITKNFSNVDVGSWNAVVSEEKITVNWTLTGGTVPVSVYYHQDHGQRQVAGSAGLNSANIGITAPGTNGVLLGQEITNVHRYDLYLELSIGGGETIIKGPLPVWNIPGMNVSLNSQMVEISTAAQFAAISSTGLNKQYVLMNDITLPSTWAPIGSGSGTNAFTGKFYGNGHTITVNSDPANKTLASTGVFGYVSGAEIRDLTVHYAANVTINSATTPRIGGLAGYAGNGAKISNIIVKGTTGVTLSYFGGGTPYFGGIVGELNGAGTKLENAYSNLHMSLSSSAGDGGNNSANNVRMGGLAGYVENANVTNCVWAANTDLTVTSCAGRIYAGGIVGKLYSTSLSGSNVPTIENAIGMGNLNVGSTGHSLHLGGLAGQASASSSAFLNIKNCRYEAGYINASCYGTYSSTVTANTYSNIGGLVGTIGTLAYNGVDESNNDIIIDVDTAGNGPSITGSRSKAAGITVSYWGSGNLSLGGFAGLVNNTTISNAISESPLAILKSGDVYHIMAGGFIGYLVGSGNTAIEQCSSSASISVDAKCRGEMITGGLIGYIFGDTVTSGSNKITIKKCSASGDQSVRTLSASCSGGLIGYMRYATATQCRADGNVNIIAASTRTGGYYLLSGGGLVGYASLGSQIENSYALGNVEVDDPFRPIGNNRNEADAGGLVGRTYSKNGISIIRCFAKGMVIAQGQPSSDKVVYAGGIVGYRVTSETAEGASIQNCVALNGYISARGGDTRNSARIYAYPSGTIGIGNNALSVTYHVDNNPYPMYLDTWTDYGDPTTAVGITNPSSSATGPHGLSTTSTNLINTTWSTLGFTGTNGWSTSGISRGYPRLAWEFN